MDKDERRNLYDKGLFDREIAAKLDVTRNVIWQWREQRGLVANRWLQLGFKVEHIKKHRVGRYKEPKTIETNHEILTIIKNSRDKKSLESNISEPNSKNKEAWFLRRQKIISLYHKNKHLSWDELTALYNDNNKEQEVSLYRFREIIGRHLMRVCRAQKECAYKALLPEYEVYEEG